LEHCPEANPQVAVGGDAPELALTGVEPRKVRQTSRSGAQTGSQCAKARTHQLPGVHGPGECEVWLKIGASGRDGGREVWLKDRAFGVGEQEVEHTDVPKRAVTKREGIILVCLSW
jgi:hypothetical protein